MDVAFLTGYNPWDFASVEKNAEGAALAHHACDTIAPSAY